MKSEKQKKIAVIDFGSNSTRLLITKTDDIFHPLVELTTVTRLSEGAFEDGILKMAPVARTLSVAGGYLEICRKQQAQVRSFGTNILREAKNSGDFLEKAGKLGLTVKILSGKDEAYFNYLAVKNFFRDDLDSLAVDLGGGSMELIYWRGEECLLESKPVGCIRFLDDWESGRFDKIRKAVLSGLNQSRSTGSFTRLIGIGGTATTLASIDLSLPEFDQTKVQGHGIPRARLEKIYRNLSEMDLESRKKIPGMDPTRADALPCGALIILTLMEHFSSDLLLASHYDLMYGYAIANKEKTGL
ncbi:MAG: hypothetical protein PHW04_08750 [Candidatus Wallbacteria bacterium]|nr:hypothetical protein [Candidatus Wallbacteria bacterium]